MKNQMSSKSSSILPGPLTATENNVKVVLKTVHFQYQLTIISILMLGERGCLLWKPDYYTSAEDIMNFLVERGFQPGLPIKGVETRNTFIVG